MDSKKEESFMTITLEGGAYCQILVAKGMHYFNALTMAKGYTAIIFKYLIVELCIIDGKRIEDTDVDEMLISDVVVISEIIGTMMKSKYKTNS